MRFVIAVIIFSVVILIHELGHFLLAKKNHIEVLEFSLGMGPRIISTVKGGTRYSVKLFPLGGSCAMAGEDAEDDSPGTFNSAPVWGRIAVVAAGPVFNFLLAFVLSVIIVGCIGYDPATVLQVTEGSAAEKAGLKEGDIVKKINHSNIHVAREVTNYVTFHQKQSVTMTVERDGKDITVQMDPVANESGRYIFGISCSSNYREKCGILGTLKYSAYEVKYWIQLTIESIKMLFTGQASINDMSGPVGVVSYIGETYQESQSSGGFYVWLNMLNISIFLTANLGVMNLLPIPALDGGRLVFLIIELIRGKRIDPEKEGMVHFVGLMLLMLLMVMVMFNDVRKIFF